MSQAWAARELLPHPMWEATLQMRLCPHSVCPPAAVHPAQGLLQTLSPPRGLGPEFEWINGLLDPESIQSHGCWLVLFRKTDQEEWETHGAGPARCLSLCPPDSCLLVESHSLWDPGPTEYMFVE